MNVTREGISQSISQMILGWSVDTQRNLTDRIDLFIEKSENVNPKTGITKIKRIKFLRECTGTFLDPTLVGQHSIFARTSWLTLKDAKELVEILWQDNGHGTPS